MDAPERLLGGVSIVEIETIANWLRSEYNDSISVYEDTDHVRWTNGSAGCYVDIYPDRVELQLEGERYGEQVRDRCADNKSALLNTLPQAF